MTGKRGRPLGHRLSDCSKRAISESKKGQRHSRSTRDKISRSLTIYFRNKNPLSEEMINRYSDDSDLCEWVQSVSEELDEDESILTNRVINNITKIERTYGSNIELFCHNNTPELICLFKEYCRLNGLDPEEAFDALGDRVPKEDGI